jgi:hypothetical protein
MCVNPYILWAVVNGAIKTIESRIKPCVIASID